MSNRLLFISNQISNKYINSSIDYLYFTQLLSKQQNSLRLKIRKFVEEQIRFKLNEEIHQAKFPENIVEKIKQLDIIKYFLKKPYGQGWKTFVLGVFLAQISRGDAGISTFVFLQAALIGYTIQALGSQQQKQQYLPKIKKCEVIGGWALTQKLVGSDASSIETNLTKINQTQYVLNGNKRWIGNANKDIVIIWARNNQNKKIQGYIIPNKTKGFTSTPIKNKIPLRMVQNCDLTFDNVLVDKSQKLEKGNGFGDATSRVLRHSRVFACWIAVGIGMGVYDTVIDYSIKRKQFSSEIASFQMIQQKIVKIMSNLQASMLFCYRISQLVDDGSATMGQIAMTKAYVTERIRQVAKWGRQIMGGNGITTDNYVIKALTDIQVIYTYEGTYDINTLISGRQLTGLSAFKK